MTSRLAERLASEDHPWPDFAAAVIAERGRAGLARAVFAATIGVSEEMLAGVEDGALGDGPSTAAAARRGRSLGGRDGISLP